MTGPALASVLGDFLQECRRTGYFVRSGTRSGRMNRGPWWELTDGRGAFWQVSPIPGRYVLPEDMPHLVVDHATELPAPIEAARCGCCCQLTAAPS